MPDRIPAWCKAVGAVVVVLIGVGSGIAVTRAFALESRVTAVETREQALHEDVIEIKRDVKELLKRGKENGR